MPVALVAFSANDGGDLVDISAGEHVIDGHPLVLAHPERFSAGKPVRRAPRAKTTPVAQRAAAGTRSPSRVELSPIARQELEELASGFDGDEAAAGLFGYRDGDVLVVEDVLRMSAWAQRSPTSVEIESDDFREYESRFRDAGSPIRYIGDVHTHPDERSQPSNVDLDGWARSVRPVIGYHLGAIVSLRFDRDGWPWVHETRAWVTSGGETVPVPIS